MQLIAHRGYSFIAPENTLAAFEKAIQCGARAVECDLQRTRDGHVVVLHDGTLNRTTTARGAVRRKTLHEIRSCSAGYSSKFGETFVKERIPTFQELLRLLQGRAHLYAEIKQDAIVRDGSDRREMIRAVGETTGTREVTFISFEWAALEEMRAMDSTLRLGLLFDRFRPGPMLRLAGKIGAWILMGRADLVERHSEFVREAHDRKLRIGVYTVDALPRLRELQRLGVDAAATNRIGEFISGFHSDNL